MQFDSLLLVPIFYFKQESNEDFRSVPQYTAEEFKSFCEKYGISHQTSSPHTTHANGEAQTVKKLWNKTVDYHLALLDYRTTPPISCFVTCSSTDG